MYHLLRLTVKNATAQRIQTILTEILVVEGPVKARAIANVEKYVTGHELYDECFDSDLFECRDPASVKLGKDVSLEVAYREYV